MQGRRVSLTSHSQDCGAIEYTAQTTTNIVIEKFSRTSATLAAKNEVLGADRTAAGRASRLRMVITEIAAHQKPEKHSNFPISEFAINMSTLAR